VNRLALAVSILAVSAGTASAADLVARPYTKAPPPMVAAIYDWSGFYVGANAGYGWGRDDHADRLLPLGGFWTNGPAGNFSGIQRINPRGGIFGGQAGYNWQLANWVFGLELAGDWSDLRRTDASIFFPGDSLTSRVESIFTATGRVGYALNNWLPYIKGGYAVGSSLNHSEWRSGYTVGAGLEYGITPNWTIGAEYAYMDFGSRNWSGATIGPGAGPELYNDKLKISAVTARINYKIGGWSASRY
jgi:outer membrane immunogenic protein